MRLTIDKNHFIKGIQVVQNVISSKANLPILSYLALEARENNIYLSATDLDIGITCEIPADIAESGKIIMPAKKTGDIIREFPENIININTTKNNLVSIESKKCQFKIMGLPYDEFPKLPKLTNQEVIKIHQDDLQQMLSLVSFAVSHDETRYTLNGVLFQIQNNNLSLVATDGRRLAYYQKNIDHNINKSVEIIIPIKAIHEINRNLTQEGEVLLGVGTNQILLDFGKIQIISRLIEGEFPDYRQIIPTPSSNKIKINREQFLLATKRAALLTTLDYQAMKLEVFKNKLVVSKSTPDVGESREEVSCEYAGKNTIIGFNPNYLIDVLKNLNDEFIELEITDSEKPGIIRSDGYIYIILPIKLA